MERKLKERSYVGVVVDISALIGDAAAILRSMAIVEYRRIFEF